MSRSRCHRAGLLAAAAVAALLPALAPAQQPCPQDRPGCAAEGGAERIAPPLPERVRTLDESLQHEHDELLRQLTADARDRGSFDASLKAQHAAWLKYRDATCALAGMPGGAAGSAASTRTQQCKAQWAEAQRMRLWTALDCIAQLPPQERAAGHERCLQALVAVPRP